MLRPSSATKLLSYHNWVCPCHSEPAAGEESPFPPPSAPHEIPPPPFPLQLLHHSGRLAPRRPGHSPLEMESQHAPPNHRHATKIASPIHRRRPRSRPQLPQRLGRSQQQPLPH